MILTSYTYATAETSNATSQSKVEDKLDRFVADFCETKRESSLVSISTIDSLKSNDRERSQAFRHGVVGKQPSVIEALQSPLGPPTPSRSPPPPPLPPETTSAAIIKSPTAVERHRGVVWGL